MLLWVLFGLFSLLTGFLGTALLDLVPETDGDTLGLPLCRWGVLLVADAVLCGMEGWDLLGLTIVELGFVVLLRGYLAGGCVREAFFFNSYLFLCVPGNLAAVFGNLPRQTQ